MSLATAREHSNRLDGVDLFTDFQLQIEHAVDFEDRQYVLFIDASVSCSEPFECQPLQADRDDSFTTHAMSPSSVLAVYKQLHHREPPPAYLLSIRAYEFGLGKTMSAQAKENLQKVFQYLIENDRLDEAVGLKLPTTH